MVFPRRIASGSLIGPRGREGLPGVNAVENDTAVGTYLATDGTDTANAADDRISTKVAADAGNPATAIGAALTGVIAGTTIDGGAP